MLFPLQLNLFDDLHDVFAHKFFDFSSFFLSYRIFYNRIYFDYSSSWRTF